MISRLIPTARFCRKLLPAAGAFLLWVLPGVAPALTLQEALDLAVNRSSRGQMIRDDVEVAEQKYFAERVNFYLPEISLNGSLPSYAEEESFRFFGGSSERALFQTRNLDLNTDIKLEQSLIFGGDVTFTANLSRSDTRYPITSTTDPDDFLEEVTEETYFDFKFQQPILQPSQRKNDLHDRNDDMQIARLERQSQVSELKKEVSEAFFGVLHTDLLGEINSFKYRSATLQADIDSAKLVDGVASEETRLESASLKLDAELELIDAQNQAKEQHRTLLALLDLVPTDEISPVAPSIPTPPDGSQRKRIVGMWSESIPIQKAVYEFNKADRAARFAASAHGLNATLDANYSVGRGNVEATFRDDRNINTNSWGIAVNFTYPIWDGGSSGAEVRAARLEAERARLEYQQAQRAAQAEIVNLINQIDLAHRKLQVLQQKIEIERNKLAIARSRFDDGQISELTYIENQVSFLESRKTYLEELKKYYLVRFDLESKFLTNVT